MTDTKSPSRRPAGQNFGEMLDYYGIVIQDGDLTQLLAIMKLIVGIISEERERFDKISWKFEAMAEEGERLAQERRAAPYDNYAEIAGLESAAKAYRRCAEEVRRAINGDTPPPNEKLENSEVEK